MKKIQQELSRERAIWRLKNLKSVSKNNQGISKKKHLCAPVEVSIWKHDHRSQLIKMLTLTRQYLVDGHRVSLDFSRTQRAYSVGTILLYAELHRLSRLFANKIKIVPPVNGRTNQAFKQIGLYKTLNQKVDIEINHDTVVHWRSVHGFTNNAEAIGHALTEYSNCLEQKDIKILFGGTTEAMINSEEHAYIQKRADKLDGQSTYKDWWMFSQLKEGKLTVVMCDLGAGIPNTFPIKHKDRFQKLKAIISHPKDSQIILEAVGYGQSRTGKEYRGKGLPQIIDSIQKIGKNSIVMIDSNRGRVLYKHGQEKPVDINYNDSIMGTIISWEAPIKQAEAE